MWIRDPLPHDLFDIAAHMRPADAEEIFMFKRDKDRQNFAVRLYRMLPGAVHACVFGLDSQPRAIGFLGLWAKDETVGLCEVAMFARPGYRAVARDFIGHVGGTLIPFLMEKGIRRVECRVRASYRSSRALLRACGAVEETELRDFAPSGESFILCAWRRSDRSAPDVLHAAGSP